ncbi:hypothetical protein BMS3Abin07_01256 [bacterium BMS3Abin07]|nr:hypothetical protein BMS3Abin07_01256 [bacterium BMS3Abin07]GBE33223.1 hypothetical protein BMS3Bbin05_02162 [bacterium BMS3Bbin05]HDO22763.1 hypothetical protein [Nitrospirota bacterium]HDZ87510.1 hypothetical protein [Nitrospirota bacterium]
MALDKEKEIMKFAGWFLHALLHRCLKQCGRNISIIEFPVFKKFLTCRVKRELEYYRAYLDMAIVLCNAGAEASDRDIDELLEGSRDLDQCLSRDILFLPIRVHFDYDKILPLRRARATKQISLFKRLLSTEGADDYNELVRKTFTKEEFLDLHNEILELYIEETFIINSSLTSVINVDSEGIANRMYCSMLDMGRAMNREIAATIFGND